MIKNCLFAMAMLSLALAGGCAKGGNGVIGPQPSVTVQITSPADTSSYQIYPTQTLTLTATVSNSTSTTVTWSLTGPGTLTPATTTSPATATYVAPSTVPAAGGTQPTITATLASDTSITGAQGLTVVDISTVVSPASLSIGKGLAQQFTAVVVPNSAPQTFAWTCTAGGQTACASFVPDPNVAGAYLYTANDSCSGNCIKISAVSTLDPDFCSNNPKSCTAATAAFVTSRLNVNSTYAFQFSGYESGQPLWIAGTFTTGTVTKGVTAIVSGVEEVLTPNGLSAQNPLTITGSYQPTSLDTYNSNNAGTLTLTLTPANGDPSYQNQYQVVLDGAGDIQMIESDSLGTGSGIAQKWTSANQPALFAGDQTFAFGFSGVDSGGFRVGYAGILPMNGTAVVGGQMDANDNGSATNLCGNGPCSITNATYTADATYSGLWHMTLTPGTGAAMHFDFFISSGTTSKTNPLTFYAISTDTVDATHPAVAGTMVLQDSTQTYNTADFNGTSVSALTGTGTSGPAASATIVPGTTNVSLQLGTTDGKGTFSGEFDQNNDGVVLTATTLTPFSYTYAATEDAATNTYLGRYTFNMLGNPNASTAVAPLPFVLYASGQNRGFLLDQSSASVMTGTMSLQGKIPVVQGLSALSASELPSTFAAATIASFAVDPIASNLFLTSTGEGDYEAYSTQYPPFATPLQTLTGTYTLQGQGTGTITLAAPSPSTQTYNYAVYAVDTSGCSGAGLLCTIQDFLMIDEDTSNTNPSIIFATQ
ncbi:MAG: hypothetical protein WCF68_08570 [Terriglobales bacterium]